MTLARKILFVILLAVWQYAAAAELTEIHQRIANEHPAVSHINSTQLLDQIDSAGLPAGELVLFDVREEDEFAVSHLQRAIQIDPDMSADEFREQFASRLEGKTVVFYCSVGRRSSVMAERVQQDLVSSGVEAVYNLENGIFGWHNHQLPLQSGDTQTPYVHPYNWLWSRYLDHRELLSYSPKEQVDSK